MSNGKRTLFFVILVVGALIGGCGSSVNDIVNETDSTTDTPDVPAVDYSLLLSANSTRVPAVTLEGSIVVGDIYVFVEPEDGISIVDFFIDDPLMSSAPAIVDDRSPYDLAGANSNDTAVAYDSTQLADGSHEITTQITLGDDQAVIRSAMFTVNNNNTITSADFSISCTVLSCTFDAQLGDPAGELSNHTWDFGDSSSGTGISPTHEYAAANSYTVTHQAEDTLGNVLSANKLVSVTDNSGCPSISPLECNEIRIIQDLVLDFSSPAGGLVDQSGLGTGFTMVDQPSFPGNPQPNPSAPGYWPAQLALNTASGVLTIDTTSGLQFAGNNTLDNALGVGLNVPGESVAVEAVITNIPAAPGGFAQGGIWFGSADEFGRGSAEDDYIKLALVSSSPGVWTVEALMEQVGTAVDSQVVQVSSALSSITLKLAANPVERTVTAFYNVGGGDITAKVFTSVPDTWFSFDQAGIDPTLSTRSFGGIYASNRNLPQSISFDFDQFSVTEFDDTPVSNSDFEFVKWSLPVSTPTATAWGPDGRLYVTELFGTIHAFTLDIPNQQILDEQIIDTVKTINGGSSRLTLGLAIDPNSTASDVVLWVGNSDGSLNSGSVNSGRITRLSGASLEIGEDIITGLPRAIANHGINNVEFGPDGRLFISAGGSTGAGAANSSPSEFGNRPEQPLSAAILVADVNAPGFQGSCATPIGSFGIPATCDVQVYASGLRNSYDSAWHRNGHFYATDNGLGVLGTVPPVNTAPCTQLADPAASFSPSAQSDLLHRIEPGKYYGHPNPYRDECVFKDGSFQGVGPLASFSEPMFELGLNRSANGIIEYTSDRFYGQLSGKLLLTNYSIGDNVTAVTLNSTGTAVLSEQVLLEGFNNPLPITQDDSGNVFVGELSGNVVTVLIPQPLVPAPTGSWKVLAAAPTVVLDAGGAGVGTEMYMVGGKTSSGHVSTMYSYDVVTNVWSQHPSLPGVAVENPAVVSAGGLLYAFGGSTAPFSGAQATAHVYDPMNATWSALAPMITARGGAGGVEIDGKIYVVGGMDSSGASLDSIEVFDIASGSWSIAPAMQVRRDNPGVAALAGKVYVFGGRTRNANGSVVDGTLSSVEYFDPATVSWNNGASMPSGRRTMVVGTIDGRAQVMGGESPVTAANEEYDPATDSWRTITPMATGRHGGAHATIFGRVYVAGGGPVAGSSYTDSTEVFAY